MWVWCHEAYDVCGCGLQPILVAHDLSAMYVN